MKLDWRSVLGIAISVVLLWWVFRGEDLGEIAAEIGTANPWLLLAAAFVATFGFLLRAMRWKVLLHPLRPDTTLHSRFASTSIGFMANNVLPARVGEFARAFSLARLEKLSLSGSFASLVVERFLDAVVILALLFLSLASPSFPTEVTIAGQPLGVALRGMMIALGVLLFGIALVLVFPRQVVRVAERVAGLLPRKVGRLVVDVLEAFLDGLGALQDPKLLVQGLTWSFGFWLWHITSFWLAFKAFDIDLDYAAAMFVNGTIAFAVAVPSGPGFFGTFEAGAKIGLVDVFGVPESQTLAFAIGYHMTTFLPITLIGLWYAWRVGFTWKDVGSAEESVEEAVEADHPEIRQGT